MISAEEMAHLAALSRLEIGEEEKKSIQRDLEAILAYVTELDRALPKDSLVAADEVAKRNVLREDSLPVDKGEIDTERGYFTVKQVQ